MKVSQRLWGLLCTGSPRPVFGVLDCWPSHGHIWLRTTIELLSGFHRRQHRTRWAASLQRTPVNSRPSCTINALLVSQLLEERDLRASSAPLLKNSLSAKNFRTLNLFSLLHFSYSYNHTPEFSDPGSAAAEGFRTKKEYGLLFATIPHLRCLSRSRYGLALARYQSVYRQRCVSVIKYTAKLQRIRGLKSRL